MRAIGSPAIRRRARLWISKCGDGPGNLLVAEEHLVRRAVQHVRNEQPGGEGGGRTGGRKKGANFVAEIGNRAGQGD